DPAMATGVRNNALAAQPAARAPRLLRLTPVLMVLPAVLVLLAITIFPLLYTLRLTVLSWELTTGFPPQLVGLQNFVRALSQDPRFWNAMMNTGILVVAGVGLQTLIGTSLALELNQLGRSRAFVLSLLLIPVMIAPVIAGFQFRMIYNDQFGPLNFLLDQITGGRFRGYAWLADPRVALGAVMFTDVWQWTPFMALVVLAGLQSIPGELFEAAEVDGATGAQMLWRVAFPLLLPVIVIGVLVRFMDTFKLFDIVYQLTGGGPGSVTETIAYYTYLEGFKFFSLGYTSAIAFIQLVVITIVAQVFLRYQRRVRAGMVA
ncbi:MAG TPA: sugar ABC transporter permease, partial [bacterium]|nr:sugar ABC transporter permease [bacterium]